jgi:hypothetical protein
MLITAKEYILFTIKQWTACIQTRDAMYIYWNGNCYEFYSACSGNAETRT